MDPNYSRWMSADPDAPIAEPEAAGRRFSLPRPPRSVVASGVIVGLVALGGIAMARSITSSDDPTQNVKTVDTATAEPSSGPGAARVEEATTDEVTAEPTPDVSKPEWPAAPPRIERRHLGPAGAPPPGPPPDVHRLRPPPGVYDSDDSDD